MKKPSRQTFAVVFAIIAFVLVGVVVVQDVNSAKRLPAAVVNTADEVLAGQLATGDNQIILLPPASARGSVELEKTLLNVRNQPLTKSSRTLSQAELAQLLWAAIGENGSETRTVPAIKDVNPVNLYVFVFDVSGLKPGLYAYDPNQHALLLRKEVDVKEALSETTIIQTSLRRAAVALLFTANAAEVPNLGSYREWAVATVAGQALQNTLLQGQALGLTINHTVEFNRDHLRPLVAIDLPADLYVLAAVGK